MQKSILSFFSKKPPSTPTQPPETPDNLKRPLTDLQDVTNKKLKTPSHSHLSKDALFSPPSQKSPSEALAHKYSNISHEGNPGTSTPAYAHLNVDAESVHRTKGRVRNAIIDSDEEGEPSEESKRSLKKLRKKAIIEDDDYGEMEPDSVSAKTPKTPKDRLKMFSMTGSTPASGYTSVGSTPLDRQKTRVEKFKEKNEERYSWLVNILDKNKRAPDHPDYDAKTLHIPTSAFNKMTDFEKQFWQIKSEYWDTVVFFKKGKFYELYEKDADIGHKYFDLKMTDRTNMRMVGVPESSFSHWASQFIAKGYKVAQVDQMENMVGKSMREKSSGKKDKVIKRELKRVLTSGTLSDSALLTNDMSIYCMSVKEVVENGKCRFGIAFIDTSTSEINLSEFEDDADLTRLETLLVQVMPKELVLEKGKISSKSLGMMKRILGQVCINMLVPETEYWDVDTTKYQISTHYFKTSELPPPVSVALKSDLLLASVGGLISYFKTLKLDDAFNSCDNIKMYSPIGKQELVLDGQTMLNLEIFENSSGGTEGTLFEILNHCTTGFGKRLFKKWVAHPLSNVEDINARLDAIDDLSVNGHEELLEVLKKMPDLERIVSRIHCGNCRTRDFQLALKSFKLIFTLKPSNITSDLLLMLYNTIQQASNHLESEIEYFINAIDFDSIENDMMVVRDGFDEEYDLALKEIESVKGRLDQSRVEAGKSLGTRIVFKDLGKEIYQMEVSSKIKVPSNWVQMSKAQGVVRYWSPAIKSLVYEILEANEKRDKIQKEIKQRMYKKFDLNFKHWFNLVKSIAELDCLSCLVICKQSLAEPICRPQFLNTETTVFNVQSLRHPCILQGIASDFIPNDTVLGGDDANLILLTGPNMGGKSTLLRQTCIAVIMAQLGSYVPAAVCQMTTFDRIFTRIGANDNILAGQSTFMVELAETSKILKEATPKSLVILDELGRGTSTFDGYAIAYAVLHYLVTHVRCLGLFSTHYQMLTEEFKNNPFVKLMFMNFYSDDENRDITFLYKLTEGVCPKSFGMVVANMAGVPTPIIDNAQVVADKFETEQKWHQNQLSASQSNLGTCAKFVDLWNLGSKQELTDEEFDVCRQIIKCL